MPGRVVYDCCYCMSIGSGGSHCDSVTAADLPPPKVDLHGELELHIHKIHESFLSRKFLVIQ